MKFSLKQILLLVIALLGLFSSFFHDLEHSSVEATEQCEFSFHHDNIPSEIYGDIEPVFFQAIWNEFNFEGLEQPSLYNDGSIIRNNSPPQV